MRINRTTRNIIQTMAALIVVVLVGYFFKIQFARNWDQLRAARFSISYPLLALSLTCILVSYLIATAAWRMGANSLATGRKFSLSESVGMVNTTQLTKYIPGKVWSYAVQIALVDRSSLSISGVLYVNLLLALTKSFIALIVGGLYFCLSSALLPRIIAVTATAVVVLIYVFFLLFNGRFFSILLKAFGRIFNRTIELHDLGLLGILCLQGLSLISAFAFALSALIGCRGIGFNPSVPSSWSVFAGFLFADTVGFLAFFVPGGIGVREGLFFLMLSEYGAGSLALVLPIVMRLVSMIGDAILGLVGVFFLRKYVKDGSR